MARRKLLWIGIPTVAALCLIALLAVAVRERSDPAFAFLEKLHPVHAPYREGSAGGLFTPIPSHRMVLIFPNSLRAQVEDGIGAHFPPLGMAMSQSSSRTSGSSTVLVSEGRVQSYLLGDRQLVLVEGDYVDSYGHILLGKAAPPDSIIVVTGSPLSPVERAVDAVLRFLHIR
ncbi:MAG TPA: hypothetical protein VG820_06995 [Fimbriimonadaceae bacterium]|nr:hypothetical protein [Fimbriimonadaceae bacterium]